MQSKDKETPGKFFGIFKAKGRPFFDEGTDDNYLCQETKKTLLFRVLIKPDKVFAKGITEHQYLDSLENKKHPSQMCWSLIYRKLRGSRGCTMITDYEYKDFLKKIKKENDNKTVKGKSFSFDSNTNQIIESKKNEKYMGRREKLDILKRIIYKNSIKRSSSYETHLQAYLIQNINKDIDSKLREMLLKFPDKRYWIGNEVFCGVGMQRIDILLKQEIANNVFIRLIELKDEEPTDAIIKEQIPWYLDWLSYYIIPTFHRKKVTIVPTIIAKGSIPANLEKPFSEFKHSIAGATVEKLEYIGFEIKDDTIEFKKGELTKC